MSSSAILPFLLLLQSSFYTLTAVDIDGNQLTMSDYEGKKILIVNVASGSAYSSQFQQLEQLYQAHKDSLVVLAFPSNDFSNEPLADSTLKDSVVAKYNIHYSLAAKINTTGADKTAIYQWLTQQSLNGQFDQEVSGDFQKYLIGEDGKIIGVFAAEIAPLDSVLVSAIETTDSNPQ